MFNVAHLITVGGLFLISAIIFSESGMMVGFFLPGDTLLVSAGVFAAQGKLPIVITLVCISAAAIIGDNVGYQIGRYAGPRLFKKDSLVFRHDYIMRAEAFYEKYGTKTMLVAHYVPVVRAFAPVTAGAGRMPRRLFILFDAIGCLGWTLLVTLFGYFIASKIPGVEHYVEPVLIAVVLLTLLPTLYHILKDPRMRNAILRRGSKKSRQKPADDAE